jgi:hypothetical protein
LKAVLHFESNKNHYLGRIDIINLIYT